RAVRRIGRADVTRPLRRPRLERMLVILVAAHSYAVGLALLLFPRFVLGFGGWDAAASGDLFFPRQGGAFHVVLATAYLVEYFRHGGVSILVTAKLFAATFLFASVPAAGGDAAPWAIPLSGLSDAAMGLVVLGVRRFSGRAVA
ncbi:hypothetical protein K8I85_13175, partial [bacterium]|nr:hypothetical protein [bacterium]